MSSFPCLSSVVSSKRPSSSETTCGSAGFVRLLFTFVAEVRLQKFQSRLEFWLQRRPGSYSGSGLGRRGARHTHTQRHTLWQEERSPTVGPLLNVVHRRTFQSPKSRPEPLHVIMYMFETSLPIPIIQIIIIPKNPNPCMLSHAGWPCTCTGTTCLLYTGYSTVLQACTSCCYHNYSPHRKRFRPRNCSVFISFEVQLQWGCLLAGCVVERPDW